ncbi:MAG: hypothetical protein WDZ94_04615 [Patescibacteria group bacterium]
MNRTTESWGMVGTTAVRFFTTAEINEIDHSFSQFDHSFFKNEQEKNLEIIILLEELFSHAKTHLVVLANKIIDGEKRWFCVQYILYKRGYTYRTIDKKGYGYNFATGDLDDLAYFWGVAMNPEMISIISDYRDALRAVKTPEAKANIINQLQFELEQYAHNNMRSLITEFMQVLRAKINTYLG